MLSVAFIGLGQMGSPMASNILKKGFSVKVFDINPKSVEALVKLGACAATSGADAAQNTDIIITMLPNGSLVESAVFGVNGIASTMSKDALLVDMSTINPFESDNLRQKMAEQGLKMMDCPVGRTSLDAQTGTLLLLAGGTPEQIAYAKDVLMCMGNELIDAGGPGMGIRLKIVNNYMSIALNALSAEAAVLCESMGLDLNVAIEMMSGTPAIRSHFKTTWQAKVLKGDLTPAFMLDLAHKDLGIALDVANKLHAPLSMGAVSREIYSQASAHGFGRQDWTSVLTYMRDLQKGHK